MEIKVYFDDGQVVYEKGVVKYITSDEILIEIKDKILKIKDNLITLEIKNKIES